MKSTTKHILSIGYLLLLMSGLSANRATAQQTPTSALNADGFTTSEGAAGASVSSVNLFTGAVSFPINLVSLPGRNGLDVSVNASYSSTGVRQSVGTWNLDQPTGILGLGWSMNVPKIIVDNKQTGTRTDDEFYLVEGGSPVKLILKDTGIPQRYITESYTPWIIEYHEGNERWEIVKEDGTRFLYGDRSSRRATVEWVWKWNNWIGNSTQTSSSHSWHVQQQAVAWNLSEVVNHWGDKVVYQYEQVNRKRRNGNLGLAVMYQTEASYLSRIMGPTGQWVEFLYEEKCGASSPCTEGYVEYMDPNVAREEDDYEGDAYQERYETRYLSAIETYSSNRNKLYSIELDYDFIGTGNQTKRLLSAITRVNAQGEVLPASYYNYLASGPMTGAINQVISPSGATTDYYYDESGKELIQASRQKLRIQAPDRYAEPRVWVEDDYVLVSWRVKGSRHATADRDVKLFVYQWVGRWVETELRGPLGVEGPTFEADVVNGLQNFEVATHKDFIAILPKAKWNSVGTNPSKKIFLYYKERDLPGAWRYINFSIPNSQGLDARLLSGDNFAGVLTQDGYLETFVFTRGDNFGWREETYQFPFRSPTSDYYLGKAINNYMIVQNVASDIYIRYLDENLTWKQTQFPSSIEFDAHVELTDWQLSNSFAAVQNHGFNHDSYIFQWDENFSNIQRTRVGNSANYNQYFPHFATVQDNALYTSVRGNSNDTDGTAQVLRFDGAAWQTLNNVDGQAFGSYTFGQDEFLRQADNGTGYLSRFDPNLRTWNRDILSPTSSIDEKSFQMGNRLFAFDASVYFRNQRGNWQEGESAIMPFSFPVQRYSALVRDRGHIPFVVYEGDRQRLSREVLLAKYHNGGVLKESWVLPESTEFLRYVVRDPDENATVYDKSNLVGRNIVVTYQDPNSGYNAINFEDVTELNVLLVNGEPENSNNHYVTVYPVSRIETGDGMDAARITSFDYDVATATLDMSGTQPQFGSVKVVPNSADPALTPNGFTQYRFYNSLTPDSYPFEKGYLSGVAYETQVFGSEGISTPVSSSLTNWEVEYADVKKEDNVTIVQQFQVRPIQQVSSRDGVTTTVDYTYYDIDEQAPGFGYGMRRSTSTTNTDASGNTDVVVTRPKYFWSTYPFTEDLNLLTPVVQTKKQVNNTITDVSVTTWSSWGSNRWAPRHTGVWRGTGSSDFDDWYSLSPSSRDWLITSKVLWRDDWGNIRSSIDAEGIQTDIQWDNNTHTLPVRQAQRRGSDGYEVAYTYDEDFRYLTQATDVTRGSTVRYLYDDHQRQVAVINEDGLPQQTTAAYRSVDYNNDTFSATDPNLVHQTTVRGSQGLYEDFSGNAGNAWRETETNNGTLTSWSWQNGRMIVYSSGRGVGQPDVYTLDLDEVYQGRVGVEFTVTTNQTATDYTLGFGLGELAWDATDGTQAAVWSAFFGYEQWQRFSNDQWQAVATGLLPNHSFRMKIVADVDRQVADFYVDGKLMSTDVPFQSPATGIQKIAFVQYGRGATSQWTIDNLVVYTDPVHVTTYYDAAGKVRQVQTEESATELLVSETLYDELGRAYLETKPTRLPGRFGYFADFVTGLDGNGVLSGLVSTANPDDNGYPYSRTRFENSPLSRPIASGLPGDEFHLGSGHATQTLYTRYDGSERFALTHPTGGQNLPTGEYIMHRLTDPDGVSAYSIADKAGNRVGEVVETFDGTSYTHYTTQYEYDDQGRVAAVYPPNFWDTPTGATVGDYVTRYRYDFLGRLIQETTPDGGTTTYTYDAIGRPVGMKDAQATAEGYELYVDYDDWGRVAEEGYTTGEQRPFSYRLSGTHTGRLDREARVITTGDPTVIEASADIVLRAEESVTLSTGFHAKTGSRFLGTLVESHTVWRKRYQYARATDPEVNRRGRLVSVLVNQDTDAEAEVTESYTYDVRGNVLSVTQTIDGQTPTTITYAYDNLDQVTRVDYGDTEGPVVVYGYQAYTGRMETVGTPTEADRFARYAYDGNGDLQQEQFNRGGITRSYAYNAPGWLTGINDDYFGESLSYTSGGYQGAGYHTGQIAQTSFAFNGPAGQWTGGIKPDGYSVQYAYDRLGRLQSAQHSLASLNAYDLGITTPLTYDANGNLTLLERGGSARSYTYRLAESKPNQVESIRVDGINVASYQYDLNGNVAGTDALPALAYDPFLNLTTRIERPSAGDVTFGYGMADERVYKQDFNSEGELLRSTYYVHGLSSSPLVERKVDERNNTTNVIYHLYGLNGMLATQASGQWHFLLKDHLGSTRVVTDENNLIAAHYQYTAFGEVMRSAESEQFAYRFTGQEYDEETGLHNYKARLYDSELGRFYGIDPAGQYASPYSYVGSNPISYVDPSGEAGFLYALAKAAFTGGLVGAHTAHRNGGDPWKAGLQGALYGGLSTALGGLSPASLFSNSAFGQSTVANLGYNLASGALLAGAFSGGDFGTAALSSLPGSFQRSVLSSVNYVNSSPGVNTGNQPNDSYAVECDCIVLDEVPVEAARLGLFPSGWGDAHALLHPDPLFAGIHGASRFWRFMDGPGPKTVELSGGLQVEVPSYVGGTAPAPGVRGVKALPTLDATGKVHGTLPKIKDLGRYSKAELKILHQELKQSVQQRIRVTSRMGRHRPHGQRQGAEQDLIKTIEKFLGL